MTSWTAGLIILCPHSRITPWKMPSSDDINFAFGDQWGLLLTVRFGTGSGCVTIQTGTAFWFPFLLLYRLGLPSRFLSRYYTDWDCLFVSFLVTVQIGTVCLIEYYSGFGLVLSQVGSVPQLYLRSFEVEEKP